MCVCSLSLSPPISLSSDLDNNRGMLCRSVVVSPSVSFPLLILIHCRVRASGPMPAKQVNLRGPVVGGSALVMLMNNGFCHAPLTLTLRARRRPVASACTDPPAHAQGACAVPAAVWMDANRLLVRLLISLPCFVTLLLTARRRWIPVREKARDTVWSSTASSSEALSSLRLAEAFGILARRSLDAHQMTLQSFFPEPREDVGNQITTGKFGITQFIRFLCGPDPTNIITFM